MVVSLEALNLAPATVRRVREMAERYGVSASQDAVVTLISQVRTISWGG